MAPVRSGQIHERETYTVEGITSQMGSVDPHSTISQPPCEMQNMASTQVRARQTDRIMLICYGP